MRRYVSHILTTDIPIMDQSSAGLNTVHLYTVLNVLKVIIPSTVVTVKMIAPALPTSLFSFHPYLSGGCSISSEAFLSISSV